VRRQSSWPTVCCSQLLDDGLVNGTDGVGAIGVKDDGDGNGDDEPAGADGDEEGAGKREGASADSGGGGEGDAAGVGGVKGGKAMEGRSLGDEEAVAGADWFMM
jgi:hypothetical protein